MANDREIVIKISADGSAAIAGIRSVEGATEKLGSTSALDSFKKNWLAVTAGITGAYLAFQQIWGLMDKAAEHAEKMETLDALTRRYGTTAQGLVGVIEQNSHGLIGVAAAANVAADALAKGFSPQQVAQMANVAAVMHKTSSEGLSASEAFKSLEGSITAARERGVVKMMGATIDLASSLGKQFDAMSKSEKAQAMLTAVTERAAIVERALGDEYDSAADRMQRFNNSVEKMKLFFGDLLLIIGQPFMAIIQTAMTLIYGLVGAFDTLVSEGARLTDWLGITSDATERWAKKAGTAYTNAAQSAVDAWANMKGAWQSLTDIGKAKGTGEALGGDVGTNAKRQEQINAILRKYSEERDLINAAEKDKELVRLDFWYEEQKTKLQELGAGEKAYSELSATYAEKRYVAIASWATKTSDFYIAEQKRMTDEAIKMEKERDDALTRDRILSVESRLKAESAAMSATGADPSTVIRQRAEGEREILEIRERALIDSITEQTTFEQTLSIMWQVRDVQNQIAASKRVEVAELDARRLAIEREILNLSFQQLELKKAAADREGAALAAGSPMGGGISTLFSLDLGTDPYRQDFDRWSTMQDQKVMAMEEAYQNELIRLREKGLAEADIVAQTEAQKSAIEDAYRQYDVQSDQMIQQQKASQAQAYMSIAMNTANALLSFSGSNAKAQFVIAKGVAVAMAIVQAHMAAIGAAAAVAPIPIVGPALAAAAYAKWITIGYINAALIAATAIGQMAMGGGGASMGGIGGGGGGGITPVLPAAQAQPAAQESKVINVYLMGDGIFDQAALDGFARQIGPSLTKAYADGVR